MIKKILAYGGVFLIGFGVFLVLLMPASFLWEKAVKPNLNLRSAGVTVTGVEGTVWAGQALVVHKGVESVVSWDVAVPELLPLSLPIDLRINSHAGTADVLVKPALGVSSLLIRSLDLDLSALNSVLIRQRIKLSGTVLARDLFIEAEGRKILTAAGKLSWSGGEIAYPVQREIHERNAPLMRATVETRDDGLINAAIKDDESSVDAIVASLSPEGVALLQVRRRLLDLVDEPWSPNSTERDTVFKIKKSIY